MADVSSILAALPPVRAFDFTEFGDVTRIKLSKIQRLTGGFLARNWTTIPHVTHHDDIDINLFEQRRAAWNEANPSRKLTLLPALVKTMVFVLKQLPQFNASLSEDGDELILKQYFHIGVAVDTPNGLLVPVIRNADAKSVMDLAAEITQTAEKARTKGLSMAEMSGSSICISSIGHIGGTAFTPIINAPDVAILGVTRTREHPVRGRHGGIEWRGMLPLSLSYDHRVINGADAARFVTLFGASMADPSLLD